MDRTGDQFRHVISISKDDRRTVESFRDSIRMQIVFDFPLLGHFRKRPVSSGIDPIDSFLVFRDVIVVQV